MQPSLAGPRDHNMAASHDQLARSRGRLVMTHGQDVTPDQLMQRGLFSASKPPAKRSDIRSFQTLHRPKLHGWVDLYTWNLKLYCSIRSLVAYAKYDRQGCQRSASHNVLKSDLKKSQICFILVPIWLTLTPNFKSLVSTKIYASLKCVTLFD